MLKKGLLMWLVLLVVSFMITGVVRAAEESGLCGYWNFDESKGNTAGDSSGNNNDARIYGATWVKGKFGYALQFDGIDDYVDCGSDESLNITGAITIEAWVKPTKFGALQVIISTGNSYDMKDHQYSLHFRRENKFMFARGDETKFDNLYSAMHDSSAWHHVVGVDDGAELRLFVDGEKVDTKPKTVTPTPNVYKLKIGGYKIGGYYFQGLIDEVKIYNRALSDEEIRSQWNSQDSDKKVIIAKEIERLKEPPFLDGELTDTCWGKATHIKDFLENRKGDLPKEQTESYIGYDDDNLYIAFKCYESQIDKLKIISGKHDDPIWKGDCVEVFIDINNDKKGYHHFIVNPIGIKCAEYYASDVWNGKWEAKAKIKKEEYYWTAEIAIPFASLNIVDNTTTTFGLNLCRKEYVIPENTALSPTGGSFHQPKKFAKIKGLKLDFNPFIYSKITQMIKEKENKISKMEKKVISLKQEKGYKKDITELRGKLKEVKDRSIDRVKSPSYIDNKWFLLNEEIKEIGERITFLQGIISAASIYLRKTDNNSKVEYGIGVENTLKKIRKDKAFVGSFSDTVKIYAAKGEYEGFQLVIVPFSIKELKDIKIEVGDLLNKKKKTKIDKSNITLNKVGYVKTRQPAYRVEYAGWWPDPLLPLRGFDSPVLDVKAGKVQPIWIIVKIPEDALSGDYQGEIFIKPVNSYSTKIILKIKVWDFTIPKENHIKVWANPHFYYLKRFYGKLTPKMYQDFVLFMLEHRLRGLGRAGSHFIKGIIEKDKIRYDYSVFDRNFSLFMKEGMDSFGLEPLPSPGTPYFFGRAQVHSTKEHLKKITNFLEDYTDHLKERGWLNKALVWGIDEPEGKHYDNFIASMELVKRVCPELTRVLAYAGIKIPSEVEGYFEVLNVHIRGWDHIKTWATKAQREGVAIWWCNNCGTKPPYPNWYIDEDAIDHRIEFWMAHKYGIDGIDSWCANMWGADNISGPKRWPDKFWIANAPGGNGDGHLLYPGKDEKPLSSIRLEVIRDGIEDYEYLYLLRERLNKLKKINQEGKYKELIKEGEDLLSLPAWLVESVTKYLKEPEKLFDYRKKIALKIEEIDKISAQGK